MGKRAQNFDSHDMPPKQRCIELTSAVSLKYPYSNKNLRFRKTILLSREHAALLIKNGITEIPYVYIKPSEEYLCKAKAKASQFSICRKARREWEFFEYFGRFGLSFDDFVEHCKKSHTNVNVLIKKLKQIYSQLKQEYPGNIDKIIKQCLKDKRNIKLFLDNLTKIIEHCLEDKRNIKLCLNNLANYQHSWAFRPVVVLPRIETDPSLDSATKRKVQETLYYKKYYKKIDNDFAVPEEDTNSTLLPENSRHARKCVDLSNEVKGVKEVSTKEKELSSISNESDERKTGGGETDNFEIEHTVRKSSDLKKVTKDKQLVAEKRTSEPQNSAPRAVSQVESDMNLSDSMRLPIGLKSSTENKNIPFEKPTRKGADDITVKNSTNINESRDLSSEIVRGGTQLDTVDRMSLKSYKISERKNRGEDSKVTNCRNVDEPTDLPSDCGTVGDNIKENVILISKDTRSDKSEDTSMDVEEEEYREIKEVSEVPDILKHDDELPQSDDQPSENDTFIVIESNDEEEDESNDEAGVQTEADPENEEPLQENIEEDEAGVQIEASVEDQKPLQKNIEEVEEVEAGVQTKADVEDQEPLQKNIEEDEDEAGVQTEAVVQDQGPLQKNIEEGGETVTESISHCQSLADREDTEGSESSENELDTGEDDRKDVKGSINLEEGDEGKQDNDTEETDSQSTENEISLNLCFSPVKDYTPSPRLYPHDCDYICKDLESMSLLQEPEESEKLKPVSLPQEPGKSCFSFWDPFGRENYTSFRMAEGSVPEDESNYFLYDGYNQDV